MCGSHAVNLGVYPGKRGFDVFWRNPMERLDELRVAQSATLTAKSSASNSTHPVAAIVGIAAGGR